MALSDFILKAKVNMALTTDPRVSVLDIGVQADDGHITLTGDVDSEQECQAASEIARSVEGVTRVTNEMTCGIGKREETADLVSQRFLEKLDDEWNNLPDRNPLAQADYLRWALWMVYKFRIPSESPDAEVAKIEAETTDEALTRIAGYVGAPVALVALEMMRQAEMVADSPRQNAPEIENAPLVSTPVVDGDPARAAA
jgi:hypothetical protein